jgi:hypothetical protein
MSHSKTALASFFIALLLAAMPTALVVLADPCHIFHKPFRQILPHGFCGLPSYQLAGFINSYLADDNERFDSIILGTSLSENFRPEYFAERIGLSRTMKLSMVGAVPRELHAIGSYALNTGKVKHVFWEVSPHFFHMSDIRSFDDMEKKGRVPPYLYNRSRLDDYRYVFNQSIFSSSLDILQGDTFTFSESIDRLGYWENLCATHGVCDHFYAAEDIAGIQANYFPVVRQLKSSAEKQQHDYNDFDRFIFSIVKDHCNSDLRFDLFFPPISLLWYARLSEQDFDYELYMPRYVLEKTRDCRNVRVFAFANELSITADLSNYHDPRHFYGDVHDKLVEAIADNRNQITPENIDAFELALIENVNNYRPFGSKMYPH